MRQHLVQVALGREPADLIIRGATVLNVFTSSGMRTRTSWCRASASPGWARRGSGRVSAANVFDAKGLWAVPGFGESHKHIESSMLSPEWEAALVIPLGNTWTTEGSHEFSNVSGVHNVEFWDTPGQHGSPLKIFTALGSATPPSAFEVGGGNYAYKEIAENIRRQPVRSRGSMRSWTGPRCPSRRIPAISASGRTSRRRATIVA